MQTDLKALYEEALRWDCPVSEGGQGRDKGNGWAIRHPIKKLFLYQHYLAAAVRSGK